MRARAEDPAQRRSVRLAVVRVLAAAQTSLEQGGAPVALARQTAAVS